MADTTIIAASAKVTLLEIAKQAHGLAVGLQNAAPGDRLATPNFSVQYLFAIADQIENSAEELDQLLSPSSDTRHRPSI